MYHRCWTGLDQSSYIHATDNLKRFCTMVALLYFRTTLESEVQFRDLVFLQGAGGPGNPSYGVQAHLVNFERHFQKY